jgi:hypothetical protein
MVDAAGDANHRGDGARPGTCGGTAGTARAFAPIPVIEHLCATALTRAERATFDRLTKPLTGAHRAALDSVPNVRTGATTSTLAWPRQAPGNPSANAVLAHLARLRAVRELGLPAELGRDVHENRLLRLAREGAQTAVYQIQEFEISRRYATLVAILLDTTATLTDETLELHGGLTPDELTAGRLPLKASKPRRSPSKAR